MTTETVNKLFSFGGKLFAGVALFAAGWVVINIACKTMREALRRSKLDVTLHSFIIMSSKVTMVLLLITSCIDVLGIGTNSIVAVIGAAGLAISLAMKDQLSNVVGGISLLLTKPFAVGQYIEAGSHSGTVSEIGLVYTSLNTIDNKKVFIPNSDMAQARIVNFSAEPTRRLDLNFTVTYADDFEKAKDVIGKVAKASGLALETPAPVIRVADHSATGMSITSRIWVASDNYFDLLFYMREQVKLEFDRERITIPYNRMDVCLVEGEIIPKKAGN